MESSTSDRGANLKAHKVLPRRRVISSDPIEVKENSPRKRRASESHRVEISSWIESASPTLSTNTNQRLPLTPPPLPEDSFRQPSNESLVQEILEDERLADNATPVGQSPLTPDLTPPRMRVRETAHQRYPSSAAESFTTAREFATSEDSFHRFSSPESDLSTVIQDTTRPNTLIPNGTNPLSVYARNIGLGLNLDSKHESDATIISAPPEHVSHSDVVEDPFFIKETAAVRQLDAEKRQQQASIIDDKFDVNSLPQRIDSFSYTRDGSLLLKQRIVSDRLQSHRRSLMDELPDESEKGHSTEFVAVLPTDLEEPDEMASDINEQPLLIKVETETMLHVEENNSPEIDPLVTVVDEQESIPTSDIRTPSKRRKDTSPEASQVRRLSHISTKSADVVEAIVISPPRQRHHKLRRSSKNHCLRNVSSSTNDSNRSSANSTQQAHALRHISATLPDKTNRVSLNSDSGISMGFDAFNIKDNLLPASEIPQRRSSLRSHRKKLSITNPEKEKRNSRPVTAPERLMSPSGEIMSQMHPIFDTRPHSNRRSSEPRGREVRHAPPVFIPPRSSSLSAPTSQNNSRSASMTSNARKSQDTQHKRPVNQHRSSSPHVRISLPEQDPILAKVPSNVSVEPFRSGDEESATSPFLRSSLTRTPFSAISTPGIIEYGQGTSMPIYPHNNESLLLVQHSHRPESEHVSAGAQKQPSMQEFPDPSQRQKISTPPSSRYNREGPSSQEMRRNISATSTSNSVALSSPSRAPHSSKIFNIARTPSGRRHSDSYITPLSRLATITKTTPTRQRIKTNDPSNSLSQFWRPNGFWNDLSESEDEGEYSDVEDTPITYVVRNTLGLPQQPVVMGPMSLAKRLGSLRRRKQMQNPEEASDRRSSLPSLQIGPPIPFQGFEVTPTKRRRSLSLGPITHIYGAINQKRAVRIEAQQERRRQKLKQSIGPAMLRDSPRRI